MLRSEGANRRGNEEPEETARFGNSPGRHEEEEREGPARLTTGTPGLEFATRDFRLRPNPSSDVSSNGASSSMSSEVDAAAAHAGLPAQLLDRSASRSQGWLPIPPAKPRADADEDSDSFEDIDAAYSHVGNWDFLKPASEGWSDEAYFSGPQSSNPSPRAETYEIRVRHLYHRPPAPTRIVPVRLKRLFTGHPKDGGDGSGDRYILQNISFKARPGEVLAIAGPSGAGKTSLLECLSGRVKPSSPPECILVNDRVMAPTSFRRISGYVMQDDALFPALTVLETLVFSARLRLPRTMSRKEKLARVEGLLEELGLRHATHTRVGNDMVRGVSGGERRRISIGIDVVHDPAVLILDEPTSGLDSGAAFNVVAMLRAMARSRARTVVLSIHQPSFRILQLVSSVLLLAGGRVVHHGSVAHLAARLAAAGHAVPARMTVLEFAIDTINSQQPLDLVCQKSIACSATTWANLEKGEARLHGDVDHGRRPPGVDGKVSYANNALQETAILAERFVKITLRTKEFFGARSAQVLLAGAALGTIFLDVSDDRQGVTDRLGFLIFTLSFLLNSTTEALPLFLMERRILMRETSRGAYRVSSYVVSQALVFIPFLLVAAVLYGAPSYWLVGLTASMGHFVFYCFILWLALVMANSFVAFFSALVPNYIMGQSLVSAIMGAFFLFSGYIVNRRSIPGYWIWMYYISLFKYPWEALLLNEFGAHEAKCYDHYTVRESGRQECTLTGRQVLHHAGVQGRHKWVDAAAMLGFILFYRLACYAAVRWRLSSPPR